MIHTCATLTVTGLKHKILRKTRGSGYRVCECCLPSKCISSTKKVFGSDKSHIFVHSKSFLPERLHFCCFSAGYSVCHRMKTILIVRTNRWFTSVTQYSLGTRKSPAIRKDEWYFISETSQHFTFFSLQSAVVGKPEHLLFSVLVTFIACVICVFGIKTKPSHKWYDNAECTLQLRRLDIIHYLPTSTQWCLCVTLVKSLSGAFSVVFKDTFAGHVTVTGSPAVKTPTQNIN